MSDATAGASREFRQTPKPWALVPVSIAARAANLLPSAIAAHRSLRNLGVMMLLAVKHHADARATVLHREKRAAEEVDRVLVDFLFGRNAIIMYMMRAKVWHQ